MIQFVAKTTLSNILQLEEEMERCEERREKKESRPIESAPCFRTTEAESR